MTYKPQNRNFLSPTGFKFSLKRAPKVSFFCNSANIPDLNLGIAIQPSYLKDIDTPGDKIVSIFIKEVNICLDLLDEDFINLKK